jgi:hypothetical protein
MPWLLSKSKTGRKFSWETVKDALAAVIAGTQARAGTSSLYTNISGVWGFKPATPPGTTGTTTGATAGSPGTFTGGTPTDLAALQKLGALGNTAAWKDRKIGQLQEWVRTTNGELAVWGGVGTGTGKGWVAVTPAQVNLDITTLITGGGTGWPSGTTPANLAALKGNGQAGDGKGYQADGTFGTGATPGVAFATGQFVTLGDSSKASYNGTIWIAGAAA